MTLHKNPCSIFNNNIQFFFCYSASQQPIKNELNGRIFVTRASKFIPECEYDDEFTGLACKYDPKTKANRRVAGNRPKHWSSLLPIVVEINIKHVLKCFWPGR